MLRSHLLPPYHSRPSSDPDHLSPRLSPALQPGGAWGLALMAPEPDLAPPAHHDPLPPTPQAGRSSVVSRPPSAPHSGFAGSVTRRLCERSPLHRARTRHWAPAGPRSPQVLPRPPHLQSGAEALPGRHGLLCSPRWKGHCGVLINPGNVTLLPNSFMLKIMAALYRQGKGQGIIKAQFYISSILSRSFICKQ